MGWGILNPLEWGNTVDYEGKDYNAGADWAETLVEVDADVVPTQVYRMAEDLKHDEYDFYNGFRDVWNTQPGMEPERSIVSKAWNWFTGQP